MSTYFSTFILYSFLLEMARVTLAWIFMVACLESGSTARSFLVVDNVETSVDISTPVLTVAHSLNLTSYDHKPVSLFYFTVDQVSAKHLSHIASFSNGAVLPMEEITSGDSLQMWNHRNITSWKIHLNQDLRPSRSTEVAVYLYFTSMILPDPEKIKQGQSQLVTYTSNVLLHSPYMVQKQKTTVKLEKGNRAALRYSQLQPTKYLGNLVTYGPFKDTQPFSYAEASIHFDMNTPMPVATSVEREVTISHWGQIFIRDIVKLKNKGAALKGEFSRLGGASNAINRFTSFLPAAATDIYYRDGVGSIYSFVVTHTETAVAVDLTPRYPILGGWSTEYVLGYSMPAYEYLHVDGDSFYLTMPFLDHLFGHMAVEDFMLKIVLPEGSQPLSVKVPHGIQNYSGAKIYSFFDTIGRNVLVLTRKNVVEEAISDIEVWYMVPKMEMIRKPVVISLFIWSILSCFIASNYVVVWYP